MDLSGIKETKRGTCRNCKKLRYYIKKNIKIRTPMDQVMYAGLFLTGRALEWFKPYFTKIQTNGMSTTNQEVRYMFSSWERFVNQLI